MRTWVVVCPICEQEFEIEEDNVPTNCPHCGFDVEFDDIDECDVVEEDRDESGQDEDEIRDGDEDD